METQTKLLLASAAALYVALMFLREESGSYRRANPCRKRKRRTPRVKRYQ